MEDNDILDKGDGIGLPVETPISKKFQWLETYLLGACIIGLLLKYLQLTTIPVMYYAVAVLSIFWVVKGFASPLLYRFNNLGNAVHIFIGLTSISPVVMLLGFICYINHWPGSVLLTFGGVGLAVIAALGLMGIISTKHPTEIEKTILTGAIVRSAGTLVLIFIFIRFIIRS